MSRRETGISVLWPGILEQGWSALLELTEVYLGSRIATVPRNSGWQELCFPQLVYEELVLIARRKGECVKRQQLAPCQRFGPNSTLPFHSLLILPNFVCTNYFSELYDAEMSCLHRYEFVRLSESCATASSHAPSLHSGRGGLSHKINQKHLREKFSRTRA